MIIMIKLNIFYVIITIVHSTPSVVYFTVKQ